MRKLSKGPEPQVLIDQGATWTAAYVAASSPASRKARERWRHSTIKAALLQESDEKCAYCEAIVDHVAHDHVEHIIPKAVRRDLAHVWTNLANACPICNETKGEYFDANAPILNPFVDEPSEHLVFRGPMVDYDDDDERADVSIRHLGLNRPPLIKDRAARILKIRDLLALWHASAGPRRDAVALSIRMEAAEGEYTAAVQAYLGAYGFPISESA